MEILYSVLTLLVAIVTPSSQSQRTISVNGAGASFPAEVYQTWMASFKAYRQKYVTLNMTYQSVGSGTGKLWIQDPDRFQITYAGTDSLLVSSDYKKSPDLQMFPTLAGAVVVAYDLPGISSLYLSRHHIVGIYNGTYKWWNDPDIQQLNPGVTLPQAQIIPIARADKSGTTEIFTTALSSFSEAWAEHYGHFSKGLDEDDNHNHWNNSVIKMYGTTNRGMSGLILSIKYSVGYLSIASAKEAKLSYADIENKAGNTVSPTIDSIQSAMNDMVDNFTDHFTVNLVDSHGSNSYPIAAYTYFIVHMKHMNCESSRELYRYLLWAFYDKTAEMETNQLNFAPLSKVVADLIMDKVLSKFRCWPNQLVSALNSRQLQKEKIAEQTWRLPVFIGVPTTALLMILLSVVIIWHQVKVNMAIIKKKWLVPFESIEFVMNSRQSVWSSKVSVNVRSPHTASQLKIGRILDDTVCLRELHGGNPTSFCWDSKRALLWMRDQLNHININKFFGVTMQDHHVFLLNDFCSKGMLRDILQDNKYNLDANFQYSISCDVAAGMKYLHKIGIVHGNLTSGTCWIDNRWTVKISDWQYSKLAQLEKDSMLRQVPELVDAKSLPDKDMEAMNKMWRAPELLQKDDHPNKECDAFSFSIILVEIFSREDPYDKYSDTMTPSQILEAIVIQQLRPAIPAEFSTRVKSLLTDGWSSNPAARPTFSEYLKVLQLSKPTQKNVLDCMMEAVDEYMNTLEEKVQEKTAELNQALDQMKYLLHQMLPPSVATKLAHGENVQPESFDSVTVFFSDIVGFTTISSESTPFEIVRMLNDLYITFDTVIDSHEVYKVETIGDAYMVVSGCPTRNGTDHAEHIASMAIDFAFAAVKFKIHHQPDGALQLRAGIHSGSACAGVVGHKMPRYCLFGDTVNTASRMESTSVAMKIQVSWDTQRLLQKTGMFHTDERGEVFVKGKGNMTTYWLHGKKGMDPPMPVPFLRTVK